MQKSELPFYQKQPPTVAIFWNRYLLAVCISILVPLGVWIGDKAGLRTGLLSWPTLLSLYLLLLALIYRWVNQQNPRRLLWPLTYLDVISILIHFAIGALVLVAFGYFVKEIPFSRIRTLFETPMTLWWLWAFFALAQLAEWLRGQSSLESMARY